MNRRTFVAAVALCALAIVSLVTAMAIAEEKGASTTAPAAMQLPPGWTQGDMQACMLAMTPGKMQEQLLKSVGVWKGTSTMWMYPGAEPQKSEMTSTITAILDGRYTQCDVTGTMAGAPFHGVGIYGYDNAAKKFVSSWLDNMSTGIMQGTGEPSAEGKVMTWTYMFTCPITNKLTPFRQVETVKDADHVTIEMFGVDPKTGKEYKMMTIDQTRQK